VKGKIFLCPHREVTEAAEV